MPDKITELVSEYKSDFRPAIAEDMDNAEVLANSDNDVINADVVYEFLVDGAIRAENEKTVIVACLAYDIGHTMLADAATRLAHDTQDWSGDQIKALRAKIYKYSEKSWTLKKRGGKTNPHFVLEEPTTRVPKADKPSSTVPVESEPTAINEREQLDPQDTREELAIEVAALIKKYGLADVVKAVTTQGDAIAVYQGKGKPSIATK